AYYESALEVGGDYYDFISLPQDRLAVLVGDVAGKSVAAALVMGKFSVEGRGGLSNQPDPAPAASQLNKLISQVALADRFVTFVAVVLDPVTHTATLVNAGHPAPLLYRHANEAIEEAGAGELRGRPIGIAAHNEYRASQFPLLPGDRLVIFSDGV